MIIKDGVGEIFSMIIAGVSSLTIGVKDVADDYFLT